jgi:hypothetical protein
LIRGREAVAAETGYTRARNCRNRPVDSDPPNAVAGRVSDVEITRDVERQAERLL